MPGTWTIFNAPNTSTGEFNADLMILLTDGSVLVRGFSRLMTHDGLASTTSGTRWPLSLSVSAQTRKWFKGCSGTATCTRRFSFTARG